MNAGYVVMQTTEALAAADDAIARLVSEMFGACRVEPRVASGRTRRPCPAGCDNGVIVRDDRLVYCPTCDGLGSVEED